VSIDDDSDDDDDDDDDDESKLSSFCRKSVDIDRFSKYFL